MTKELTLWEPTHTEIIPQSAKSTIEIAKCAVQLTPKDQRQISNAIERGDYEVGVSYLWQKSMAALKRELGTLGVEFIGEMVGRSDVDIDDNVQDFLSDKDALRLASELGMVTATEALRLSQTQELIVHFTNNDFESDEGLSDEMDEAEAARALKACIRNILGKPRIEAHQKFVEFRNDLLNKPLQPDSPTVELLKDSPYFFRKLSITILLSAIKTTSGASLEIALGNINSVLPSLWESVRDTEKWKVGNAYAEAYASGQSASTQGLKQALLKVKGFDFVPENLRSGTFIKCAEAILRAHDGLNNYYSEYAPVKELERLGTVIPAPALADCTSALLAVSLGNIYGVSFNAEPVARSILSKYTKERWEYYLNQCFPSDLRILNKLSEPRPRMKWDDLAAKNSFQQYTIKDSNVSSLVEATIEHDSPKFARALNRLSRAYYGKRK